MKKILLLIIILAILFCNVGVALCECDCNQEQECDISIHSITAMVNDFKFIKITIGDFEEIYRDNILDMKIIPTPLICQDKNVAIKVVNGKGIEIYNSIIVIDSTKKEVVIDYKDDSDKKLNLTIMFSMVCNTTAPPTTGKPTNTPTLSPTQTVTKLITSTPTKATEVTVSPVATSTNGNGEELPQTGESINIVALIVSLMFIITGLVLFFKHRHTHS